MTKPIDLDQAKSDAQELLNLRKSEQSLSARADLLTHFCAATLLDLALEAANLRVTLQKTREALEQREQWVARLCATEEAARQLLAGCVQMGDCPKTSMVGTDLVIEARKALERSKL